MVPKIVTKIVPKILTKIVPNTQLNLNGVFFPHNLLQVGTFTSQTRHIAELVEMFSVSIKDLSDGKIKDLCLFHKDYKCVWLC